MQVANLVLQLLDGRSKRTFGNTCCDNSVAPVGNQTSLEALIPPLFVAGRGEGISQAITLPAPTSRPSATSAATPGPSSSFVPRSKRPSKKVNGFSI